MMSVTKFVSQKKVGKQQAFAQLQAAKEIAQASHCNRGTCLRGWGEQ